MTSEILAVDDDLRLTAIGPDRTPEQYVVELRSADGWVPVGDVTLAPEALEIVIAPEHRGRGLGRRVLLRLVDRARVLGWTHLRAPEVPPGNEASHRLLTGLGFVPTDLGDPAGGIVRDEEQGLPPDAPAFRHGLSRGYTLSLAPVGGRPRA